MRLLFNAATIALVTLAFAPLATAQQRASSTQNSQSQFLGVPIGSKPVTMKKCGPASVKETVELCYFERKKIGSDLSYGIRLPEAQTPKWVLGIGHIYADRNGVVRSIHADAGPYTFRIAITESISSRFGAPVLMTDADPGLLAQWRKHGLLVTFSCSQIVCTVSARLEADADAEMSQQAKKDRQRPSSP